MIEIPILGSLALASGTLLEKLVLMKRKINIKVYQTLVFTATCISMIPFIYFFWKVSSEAFTLINIGLFILVIFFSLLANLFTFYSMKWEKLSRLEPAKITEPIFVVLLAIIFSFMFDSGLYERNFNVIIPSLIAGGALIFAHIKKHHLDFNKYFIAALLGSFFFAVELVISRLILDYYSPISFYFLRCLFIVLASLIFLRPKIFNNLNGKVTLEIFITGALWFIYRVAVYYGYIFLGIVSTTLITMLSPVFIYTFARIFLKEKISWKNILASIIIVGCVIYAVFSEHINLFIFSILF
jgi:drug/metabolite transporter (DMT)-like permease